MPTLTAGDCWCCRACSLGPESTLSCTFERSKPNHFYTSCKDGTAYTSHAPSFSLHAQPWLLVSVRGRCTGCVLGWHGGGCTADMPQMCVCSGSHPTGTSPFPCSRHQSRASSGWAVPEAVHMYVHTPTGLSRHMHIYVHSYSGGVFPIGFPLQPFLGHSELQRLPKAYTIGFHLPQRNSLPELP